MRTKNYAEADKNRCVACGACSKVCPKRAIAVWKGCYAIVDVQICAGCGKCQKICPADCIRMKERTGQ